LKSEGKEKIENIKKTRKYIEKIRYDKLYEEISEKNGKMFKKIIEGINKGNEEETEVLKLIEEITYKISFESYINGKTHESENKFLRDSEIKKYLKNKMNELVDGKEKSKENEYYIILSNCYIDHRFILSDEKKAKNIIGFFKELKMDKINTIEEKKKRLKEMLGLYQLMQSLSYSLNIIFV